MPRKVCHILGSSEQDATGIANIVAALHRHSDGSRYEVSVCFVGGDGPLVSRFCALGIPTSIVPWQHPSRDVHGAVALLRGLRRARYDVLHLHWGGPTLRRLARLATGAKVVLHLHSPIEEGRSRAKISTAGCDAVIAVSRSVAAVSCHSNTKVIHSGVDVPESPDQMKHGSDRAINVIGFAGRLEPIKGVSYILEAVAQLIEEFPDFELRIAGEGSALGQLRQQATALGLKEKVAFLGWVDAISSQRARWALMVQPSLEEGLPLGVIEAMAEGLPVVASSVGGIPELIDDQRTGVLVPPADSPPLANAIRKLLRDAALRTRMGEAARLHVKENFSAQSMSQAVNALYDELLTPRPLT